ncbi:hypothetical protein AQ436_01920 [Arthrobacter sp. EpRS66]|nr:hypothetical protein AQ436_01920 [Arthrobacter sp. EpRS66]
MAWVVIANLKGAPGDAAAMGLFQEILDELDRLNAKGDEQLVGLSDWLEGVEARTPAGMNGTDYTLALADETASIAAGTLVDGTFNFEKQPMLMKNKGVVLQPVIAPGYAFLHTDIDGYISWAVKDDGTLVTNKSAGGSGGGGDALSIANTAAGLSKSKKDKASMGGDSLSEGFFGGSPGPQSDAWPARFAALSPGVTVNNLALSGYCVDELAIRLGAFKVPLTVTGGQIPASGPVEVSTATVIGWRPVGTTRTFSGSLAGVPGTLTRSDSDTMFTFTRSTSGTAVTVPSGTEFKSDYAGHDADTFFLMIGHNNVAYNVKGGDATVADHVRKGIKRIYDWLSRDIKQVLIMSVTTAVSWTSGTANYATVLQINTNLEQDYTTRYYNLRGYLVNQAIYDLGITPTSEDLSKMAADTLPPSIMDPGADGLGDNTHYSKAVHTLVGDRVHDYATSRDWIGQ